MPSQSLIRAVLLCVLLGFSNFVRVAAAQRAGTSSVAPGKSQDEVHQLWASTVEPMLQRPVQSPAQAYQDAEMLMVPMHAAFHRNDLAWERSFSDHFQRMLRNSSQLPDQSLSRLFYLYLASQFVVVARRSGHVELIPEGLPEFLFGEVEAGWLKRPATQYEHPTFVGMRDRVIWKLNNHKVAKSYYRAFLDDELFLFAIAADLRYGATQKQSSWRLSLDDIISVADKVYTQESTRTPSGGWLLQPGVWTDHPDFKYAGRARTEAAMQPAPLPNIGWDSSHFFRAPLWLTSMMNAFATGSRGYNFYSGLRNGLAQQFFTKVLVPSSADFPCYRQNNFMDGSNGLYRWGYGSLGSNNGYGPYGVSGALLLGWWTFLETDQSRTLYRSLANQFPWSKQCRELYLGPKPANKPYTDKELDPNSSAMRVYHLIVLFASEL